MTHETLLTWWSLHILNRRRYELVKTAFGDLDTALASLDASMMRELGMREDTISAVLERLEKFDLLKEKERLQTLGVSVCCIDDELYPARLREIADPPIFLSSIGDLTILHHPCIGVVGTRAMSPYGRRVVEAFVPAFARSGCITVSGLARGVDTAVARDTMDAGGKTVAVLGHGLASVYPPMNARLAAKIVEQGGLLLSEFPLDMEPDIYTFPARNRIIAGVSMGTLVVEAPRDSGAIITARLALEYGRDVFAVPGLMFDENMEGCHRLIADGHARLVTTPAEVLSEIGVMHTTDDTQRSMFLPQSDQQAAIYNVLSGMPQSADDISLRTALGAASVATALTLMELAGAARNVGGGQWVRR